MNLPLWLKRWLCWEAMMFRRLEEKIDMNNEAQQALAAAIGAVANGVADVAAAIANHPATQADDSGQILAAATQLTGFAGQLESMAATVNGPAPSGSAAAATSADQGASAAATVAEPPAPEAGSVEGTLEPTPQIVGEGTTGTDPAPTPAS